MDIVLVAPFGFTPKSTTARRVMPIAHALSRRGHNISVVVPPYDDPASFGRCWTDAGVEIICLPRPRVAGIPGVGAVLTQLALARMATRFIRRRRPTLVHIFKPKAVSGLTQYFLWRRSERPRIVLDMDDWEGRDGWSAYEDYPRWMVRTFDFQERFGILNCDGLTTASETLHARARAIRPDVPVVKIVNGFTPDTYKEWDLEHPKAVDRCELGFAEGDRIVLVYSRFFEYPIAAWSDLIQRIAAGAREVRFLIIGAGKFGQEQDLARHLRACGLAERIHFLGWQPFRRLGSVMAVAELALIPMANTLANRSKCSIKYLDLMYAGVPVLTTPVGEYAAYVAHGQTGFVADDDSPPAVARAALCALESKIRPEIIARAHEHATTTLAWDRLAGDVHLLYEDLVTITR